MSVPGGVCLTLTSLRQYICPREYKSKGVSDCRGGGGASIQGVCVFWDKSLGVHVRGFYVLEQAPIYGRPSVFIGKNDSNR